MPQVIPAVASYIGSALGAGALAAGASTAIGTAAYFVGFYGTQVAIAYGISRAMSPKLPGGAGVDSLRSQATEINVRDPVAPRQIIYGQPPPVSGVLYPVGVSGTNNEYLHLLLLVAGHEVQELGDVYFDDAIVPLDGSGNATGTFAGYARIKKHLGTYNQTVDTALQTDLGSGYWSNDHRLQGIAYLYIRLKVSQDLFSGGLPQFRCSVKGRKLYDSRDGAHSATDATTWAWSANAELVLQDWIRGVPTRNGAGTLVRNFGLGAADAEINETASEEAANICDEWVATATSVTAGAFVVGSRYKITSAGTTTFTLIGAANSSVGTEFTASGAGTGTGTAALMERRYLANGVIATSTRAGDGIEVLKSAMAGDAVWLGGEWIIRAGAYRTPTVTLDEGDLRGPLQGVRVKPSRKELFNVVKGIYLATETNGQPADFPPVRNATYKTQDGAEDLPADIELHFTNSPACAQRLAKIILERSRQGITFTARCQLTALQVQCTDVVSFTNTRFGWSAKAFEVVGFAFAIEDDASGNPYLGVDLTLRETASGVWDWADGEETTVDLAPNTTLPDPSTVAAPTSLSITSNSTTTVLQSDGTIVPSLKATWTSPVDEYVTNGGLIRVEYKANADATWLPWSTVRGDQMIEFITAIAIGTPYDVRVRAENQLGVASSYVTVSNTTAAGDTTAPATYAAGIKVDGRAAPPVFTSTGVRRYGVGLFWAEAYAASYTYPADFAYWEVKGTATNSDGATDYNVDNGSLTVGLYRTRVPIFYFYTSTATTATYFRFRPVDTSGNAGGWSNIGSVYQTPLDPIYPNWYPPGGSILEQNANAVAITGGSITGITDIAVADGGTGSSTASGARTNLGLGSLATASTVSGSDWSGTDLAITDGGTGSSSASAARTALGLAIGTDVQAQDAELAAIAGLTSAADRLPYFTGSGTASLATFTAAGRALVDDATAAAQRGTLGLWLEAYVPSALAGGSPTESVSIDVSAAGFASAPQVVLVDCVSDTTIWAVHDYNSGSNTATNLVLTVGTRDGTNLGAGLRRYSVIALKP